MYPLIMMCASEGGQVRAEVEESGPVGKESQCAHIDFFARIRSWLIMEQVARLMKEAKKVRDRDDVVTTDVRLTCC